MGVQPAGSWVGTFWGEGKQSMQVQTPDPTPHSGLWQFSCPTGRRDDGEGLQGWAIARAWTRVSQLLSGLQAWAQDPRWGPVTTYFWALGTPSLPQGKIWASVLCTPTGSGWQGCSSRFLPTAGIYPTPQGQLGPKEVPHTPWAPLGAPRPSADQALSCPLRSFPPPPTTGL